MKPQVREVIDRWMREDPAAVENDAPEFLAAVREAYREEGVTVVEPPNPG